MLWAWKNGCQQYGLTMEASEVDAGPQRNKTGPKSEAPRLHVQTWVERRPLVSSGRAVDGSTVAPSHLEGPMPPTCIQTMQAVCSFASCRCNTGRKALHIFPAVILPTTALANHVCDDVGLATIDPGAAAPSSA